MAFDVWRTLSQSIGNLKIRNKLFVSFLLLNILPLIVIGMLSYSKSSSLLQEKTNDYTTDLLSEVSKNLELNIREINRVYYSIFTNQEVRNTLLDANRGMMTQVEYVSATKRMNEILLGYVVDRDDVYGVNLYSLNNMLFRSGEFQGRVTLSDREWELIQNNQGNLQWMSLDNNQTVIGAVSALYDPDSLKRIGYFVISFREDSLYTKLSSNRFHDQGELFIMDDQMTIISHKNKKLIHTQPNYEYLRQIKPDVVQNHYEFDIDGITHVVSYQSIGNTNWKLVSTIPLSKYSSPSIILKNWMITVIVLVSVIALILAYYLANSISKPIRKLSKMMKNVERERWDVKFVYHWHDEIGILSHNFNRLIDRIRYLINQVYQSELLKQRSQLKYLMFQINPHFLFNTLETINWLARIQGAPEVGMLSKKLGDLMREGIKGKEFVTFDQELDNVKKYIFIQQYRYADKCSVHFDIAPDSYVVTVPRFIIQPIIENAMVHGLEMRIEGGSIQVSSMIENKQLMITISDDGLGMDAHKLEEIRAALARGPSEEDAEFGIGLLNVHHRIRIHYGSSYGLSIDSVIEAGTVVRLTLPCE
jgi:two-component system sensor histidine kinase YesM